MENGIIGLSLAEPPQPIGESVPVGGTEYRTYHPSPLKVQVKDAERPLKIDRSMEASVYSAGDKFIIIIGLGQEV